MVPRARAARPQRPKVGKEPRELAKAEDRKVAEAPVQRGKGAAFGKGGLREQDEVEREVM